MKLFFNAEHIGPSGPGTPHINIRSATSTDGVNFALDPETWLTSETLADAVVLRAANGRWLIAGFSPPDGIALAYHDGSPDFTAATLTQVLPSGQVPGLLEVNGGFRLYYLGDGGIRSAFSSDGASWVQDAGIRVPIPGGAIALVADPAPAQRKDGTVVLYLKAAGLPSANPSPYDHMLYRATSPDGLAFTFENTMLIAHASVPQAYADATGRVWVYYLDFTHFPASREVIAAAYEQDDLTLSAPVLVQFDQLPPSSWANDPTPVLMP